MHRDIMNKYEASSGADVPRAERPSVKQLSAIHGKLYEDENCAPDFRVCGPHGDRAAQVIANTADVVVGGERKRRRVKGPSRFNEWRPCWRIFRTSLLALDACPPGPIDAYERRIETLNMTFPHHWYITAFAEETNRMEEWPFYRQQIEDEVRAGNPPKYWDPERPWAAVTYRASQDRDHWKDHVEKPIAMSVDAPGAAEAVAFVHC